MKTVVYLDVLLLVNFLIAWFLLTATGALTGQQASFARIMASSLLAAAASLILFAPELPLFLQLVYRFGSCALIVAVAFGKAKLRRWLTASCWFTALNLLLAGGCILALSGGFGSAVIQTSNLAVYFRLSPWLLLVLSGVCCLAIELLLRLGGAKVPPQTHGVEFTLCSVCVRVRAALDTGCHLKEPLSCQPVLLVSYLDAKARLPDELQTYLADWFEGGRTLEPPTGEKLRMVPCTTATGKTVLPAFSVGSIGLIRRDGTYELGRSVVAFACQSFDSGLYEAVYGSDFF